MVATEVASRSRGSALKAALVLVVAAVAAYAIFPGVRAVFDQQLDKVGGWNDEARRHDPVGFIDYSIGKLTENVSKFGEVKTDLVVAKAKLQKIHDDSQSKVTFASKELETFKAAYKDAAAGKSWPVTLAGRTYDEAQLKQQVNVFLTQRTSYEMSAKQAADGAASAGKREMDVLARVTESKAKLELLKTQRELVKVAKLTAETEALLAEVNEVLLQNEAATAANPVLTVEEMMKQNESGSAASNANVDAFLNG